MVRVTRNTEQIPCEYSMQLFILEKARLNEVTKEVYTNLASRQAVIISYFKCIKELEVPQCFSYKEQTNKNTFTQFTKKIAKLIIARS